MTTEKLQETKAERCATNARRRVTLPISVKIDLIAISATSLGTVIEIAANVRGRVDHIQSQGLEDREWENPPSKKRGAKRDK